MTFAVALFLVFVVAKGLVWIAHAAPLSMAAVPVALWQDAATALVVALVFLALDRLGRAHIRRSIAGVEFGVYALLAGTTVATTATILATGSPITSSFFGAAGSALEDSVHHFLTPRILVPVASVALLAIAAGIAAHRTRRVRSTRGLIAVLIAGVAITAAGLSLERHVETHGLHRNGVFTLVRSIDRQLPAPKSPTSPDRTESVARLLESPRPTATLRALSSSARGRHLFLVVLESVGQVYRNGTAPWPRPDPMPFLASLEHRSLFAPVAYTVYPESIKGFLPLLAGHTPGFATQAKDYRFELPTLATRLRDAGYSTRLYHSGRFDYLGMRHIIEERGFDRLVDAAEISGVRDSSFGVDEESTVDRILADLTRAAKRDAAEPVFVVYLPIAGHHPYDSPGGPYRGDGERSDYANAIRYADTSLQRLLEGLERDGRLANSVIAVVGDHGQAFGQHPGNLGHVFFLYEENLRVPLSVFAPGITEDIPRDALTRPVSVLDLGPTLLDLLGLGDTLGEGRSLLADDTPRPVFFYTDYSLPLVGVRAGRWKLIHDLDRRRDQLFDLVVDPTEQHDLSGEHPEIAGPLRERALNWLRSRRP